MERTLRKRIKAIKDLKTQHNLSNSQIMDMIADNGGFVSDRTVQKVFAEGSENKAFQYQTIAQIYEALIAVYGEDYATDDIDTLKHMIIKANNQIDSLIIQQEEKQEEFKKTVRALRRAQSQLRKNNIPFRSANTTP